jgi:pre-mRNA-splicing factor ATP-dependent RNA helicase DHX16
MSDIHVWVSDQLHEMLQISDRSIAEFLVGLCRKSDSPETFIDKIRETETIEINESVRSFSRELWARLPRAMSAGEKRRMENRRMEEEQR